MALAHGEGVSSAVFFRVTQGKAEGLVERAGFGWTVLDWAFYTCMEPRIILTYLNRKDRKSVV